MKTHRASGFASKSILFVLVAALAAGLGLVAAQRFWAPATTPIDKSASPLALKAVRLFPQTRTLPDFRLTLSDGTPLDAKDLRGRWTVVFLGFTHCPMICPTTLADLAKSQKEWESIPEERRPRVLFVSVDPERDTPKIMGEYAHYFHPATLAATVAEPQLQAFANALGLVYMKVPTQGGDYTMDHSAKLVLLDPEGREAGLISAPLVPADITADLRVLSEHVR